MIKKVGKSNINLQLPHNIDVTDSLTVSKLHTSINSCSSLSIGFLLNRGTKHFDSTPDPLRVLPIVGLAVAGGTFTTNGGTPLGMDDDNVMFEKSK